jgi:hypothetical protein
MNGDRRDPAASRNDGERAVKNARETGHATTLMYALYQQGYNHTLFENFAAGSPERRMLKLRR